MSNAVERYQPELNERQWSNMERKAKILANSKLVPTAYQGKPEDILAVALSARDLGMDLTTTTLSHFFVVEGRVTPSAQLLIGLAARAGHELWVKSSDDQQATICIQRKGSKRVHEFSFTMEMAKRANLLGKSNWKSYQEAMLIYRAATRGLRIVCPELVLGLSHLFTPDDVDAVPADPDTGEVLDIEDEPDTEQVSEEDRELLRRRIGSIGEAAVSELRQRWQAEDIPALGSTSLTAEHVSRIHDLLDEVSGAVGEPSGGDDEGELPYDETGRRGD